MDKEDVVHIYNGILMSHKKEQNGVICRDVDGQLDFEMDREPEQASFKRRHTDGQQAHEKMFNITNQGNANQNHNITSYVTEWLQSKRQQIASVYKDVEKREPWHTNGGNVNCYSHYGKLYGGFSIKNRTTLIQDIYLKDIIPVS